KSCPSQERQKEVDQARRVKEEVRRQDPHEKVMATADPAEPAAGRSPAAVWGQTGLLLLLFLAYSFWCRPVPSVNEPHYLTKAKHYWQPSWCAGDFFLESSNPHLVFYRTVGALTQWFTL